MSYWDKQLSTKNSLPIKGHIKLPILAENVKWMKTTSGDGGRYIFPQSNLWFHLNAFWLVCEGQAAGWNDNWTQSRLLNVGKRQVDIGTTRYYTNILGWFFLFTNSAPYSSSHLNCTSWGPSSTYTLSNHWQHPVPRQPHHPHNVWPGLSALSDPLASLSGIVDTVF